MENAIQKINPPKFGSLRAVILNGAVYFVGKDAATTLEYKDSDGALRKHVQAQDKFTFSPVKTKGQIQNLDGVKIAHNATLI